GGLAWIGFALVAAAPFLIERLHLAPDAAAFIHYASGSWMFLAPAWLAARSGDTLPRRVARVSRGGGAYLALLTDLLRAILFIVAAPMILQVVFGQSATGLITVSSVVLAVIGFALNTATARRSILSGSVYRTSDGKRPAATRWPAGFSTLSSAPAGRSGKTAFEDRVARLDGVICRRA